MKALLLAALLAVTADQTQPTLPWTTFSETLKDSIGYREGFCPGGVLVMIVGVPSGTALHQYYYVAESKRLVWAIFSGPGQDVTWIGVGVVTVEDRIPSMTWTPGAKADAMYPGGPCDYLVSSIS